MAKKYIITTKEDDVIVAFAKQLSTLENGYWHSVLADVAYPNTTCYAYDADGQIAEVHGGAPAKIGAPIEIPSEVKVGKYCYTEDDGFYPNPDYEG